MSRQKSLWVTPNAISLQASEVGLMRSGLQDGEMTGESGPEVALANLSPRQAGALGLPLRAGKSWGLNLGAVPWPG